MRWVRHVGGMEEIRNAYRILVRKSERTNHLRERKRGVRGR
jgi:hypothetical protein